MLTQNQALIIDCILKQENLEYSQVNVRIACYGKTSYDSISDAEKDLLKLKNRGLIEFDNHFENPAITDFGQSIFLQNMILRVIGLGLPEGDEYSDVKISKKLSDFDIEVDSTEISYELDILQSKLFVDGLKVESQASFHKRFIDIELITKGYIALNKPDRVWVNDEREKSRFSTTINAGTLNVAALSTGSGDNINSILDVDQDIDEILKCITSLKNLLRCLPNEVIDQSETIEILDEIESGVKSQNIKKTKLNFQAFFGVLSAVATKIPKVIEITDKALDLGEKLKKWYPLLLEACNK